MIAAASSDARWDPDSTSGTSTRDDRPVQPLAYVSLEYALSPALSLGAGPLGLRVGDALRCAVARGIPVVAVGLAYREAALVRDIDEHGQRHLVELAAIDEQLAPVEDGGGAPLRVEVELDEGRVALAAWSVELDSIRLLLLDAELPENPGADRALTRILCPVGAELRARQAELLRRGAAQLLEVLGVAPRAVVHELGEGPSPRPALDLPSWIQADVVATLELDGEGLRGADFGARVAQTKVRALWNLRARARERMIDRLNQRGLMVGDSDALWIGCAGRMGPGLRAELLLGDLARLERLLDDPIKPVRLAIAGAADPDDPLAVAALARVAEVARDYRFDGRLLLLPGEDLDFTRLLVEGVDLWLSTAARGARSENLGVAAAANGALNLAINDGWWAEVRAALGQREAELEPGWTLADAGEFDDRAGQDQFDARMLFAHLEREVVPCFYDWDREGVPQRWVERVRASLSTIPALFDGRARTAAGS